MDHAALMREYIPEVRPGDGTLISSDHAMVLSMTRTQAWTYHPRISHILLMYHVNRHRAIDQTQECLKEQGMDHKIIDVPSVHANHHRD